MHSFMRKKIKIGVFYGGISPEHEVSLVSADGVISNLDKNRFFVKEFFIDKKGSFWTGKDLLRSMMKNKKTKMQMVDLNKLVNTIDVAFPVMHGQGGEDGLIQGFFETLQIPFVGSSVCSSAICLDKSLFNQLMDNNGILKPRFVTIDFVRQTKIEQIKSINIIKKAFQFPVFVKPSRTGSSVGISRVVKFEDLLTAVDLAKKIDDKIVVEEAVNDCKEIEVAVLGNSVVDYAVSKPGRIIPANDFYDYNDKYKENKTRFELPVRLSASKIKEIQSIALQAYKLANCRGLARVDFLLDRKDKVFLNEINTMPGFTPISMYPKLWEISGLSYKNLLTKLILLALKK